jgi:hypothetical protein
MPSAGSHTNDKRERMSGEMLLLSQTVTFPEIWKNSCTSSIIMMEPVQPQLVVDNSVCPAKHLTWPRDPL